MFKEILKILFFITGIGFLSVMGIIGLMFILTFCSNPSYYGSVGFIGFSILILVLAVFFLLPADINQQKSQAGEK